MRIVLQAALTALIVLTAGVSSSASVAAPPLRPLQTAFIAPPDISGGLDAAAVDVAYDRVAAAGATAVRLGLSWIQVAPRRPAAPTDPADPVYNWGPFDRSLAAVVARGLTPIAAVANTPGWAAARRGTSPRTDNYEPSVTAYRDFVRAAAKRYDGRTPGVPRVRYWQIWVEPNIDDHFAPQLKGGKLVAPNHYRAMLNGATAAIHAVRPDNFVVAGGLSPFTAKQPWFEAIGPLRWMRALLCMSTGRNPRPTCAARVRFDIWAHHPYTSGGPTHEAYNPDDVSLGDLPEMKALLDAATRAGKIVSRGGPPRFWVTEFSWDTAPPDPKAVPIKLHARWVSEALYRMWQSGVSLVAWLMLRDDPYPGPDVQSGLYYRGKNGIGTDRPKLSLRAFRFPFVAFRERGGVTVWGRTPGSDARSVRIEQQQGSAWRTRLVVRSNRFGIFAERFASSATRGFVRARIGGETSVPFSLVVPPDRAVSPFGVG